VTLAVIDLMRNLDCFWEYNVYFTIVIAISPCFRRFQSVVAIEVVFILGIIAVCVSKLLAQYTLLNCHNLKTKKEKIRKLVWLTKDSPPPEGAGTENHPAVE
jgi:site-specific recombinase